MMVESPSGCAICFEDFDEELHLPRLLACGHSFCTPCLIGLSHKLLRAPAQGIALLSCPKCRQDTPLRQGCTPAEAANELPCNFDLLELLSAVAAGRAQKEMELAALKEQAEKEARMARSLRETLDKLTAQHRELKERYAAAISKERAASKRSNSTQAFQTGPIHNRTLQHSSHASHKSLDSERRSTQPPRKQQQNQPAASPVQKRLRYCHSFVYL